MINQDYWNLACDIAVEASISDLHIKAVKTNCEDAQCAAFKADVHDLWYMTDNYLSNRKMVFKNGAKYQ